MSKTLAVNETEICIRWPHGKDDLVEHAARRRRHASSRELLSCDAVPTMTLRLGVAMMAKILSSPSDVIVVISPAAPTTFEIPFY